MGSPGIIYDGRTLRFMDGRERELYARHALRQGWVLIIAPAPGSETENGNESDEKTDSGREVTPADTRVAAARDELAAPRL